jgi:hypothetical protein
MDFQQVAQAVSPAPEEFCKYPFSLVGRYSPFFPMVPGSGTVI